MIVAPEHRLSFDLKSHELKACEASPELLRLLTQLAEVGCSAREPSRNPKPEPSAALLSTQPSTPTPHASFFVP